MHATIRTTNSQPWIWRYRYLFTALATVVAACLYLLLYGAGLVPNVLQYQPTAQATTHSNTNTHNAANITDLEAVPNRPKQALPTRVTAPAVGIDTIVYNPASKQVGLLNDYLDQGAVRYPGSGYPGNGNLFVFGHSTSHETVINQAYKTFNRLEDLSAGNQITVHTNSGAFHYTVRSVKLKENSHAYVPFDTGENLLTISTCDSFGAKEDRVVVVAEFSNYVPNATEVVDN